MELTKWQKEQVTKKAKKAITKLKEKHQTFTDTIIDSISNVMITENDKYTQQMIVIICSSIIAGFDTPQTRIETTQLITKTIEIYNEEENKNRNI